MFANFIFLPQIGVSSWAGTSDLLLPVLGQEGNKKEGEGGFDKKYARVRETSGGK
jgi:hypothetical protein